MRQEVATSRLDRLQPRSEHRIVILHGTILSLVVA
jgi:hypothetical protein